MKIDKLLYVISCVLLLLGILIGLLIIHLKIIFTSNVEGKDIYGEERSNFTPFFYFSSIREKNSSGGFTMLKRNTDIKKIILHHVSLVDIYTAVDIPCEDFERVFDDSMKKDTITDPNEIALLEQYMRDLRTIDVFPRNTVDTRAKFYFISSSDTIEYCLDNGIVYSNGIYYETSNDLFDYIENLK